MEVGEDRRSCSEVRMLDVPIEELPAVGASSELGIDR